MTKTRTFLTYSLGLDKDLVAQCERGEIMRFGWQLLSIIIASVATASSILMGASILDTKGFVFLAILAAIASFIIDRTFVSENIKVRGFLSSLTHSGDFCWSDTLYVVSRIAISLTLTLCSMAFFLIWLLNADLNYLYDQDWAKKEVSNIALISEFRDNQIKIQNEEKLKITNKIKDINAEITQVRNDITDINKQKKTINSKAALIEIKMAEEKYGTEDMEAKDIGPGPKYKILKTQLNTLNDELSFTNDLLTEKNELKGELVTEKKALNVEYNNYNQASIAEKVEQYQLTLPNLVKKPKSFSEQTGAVISIIQDKSLLHLLFLTGPVWVLLLIKLLPLYTSNINTGSYPLLRQSQLRLLGSKIAEDHRHRLRRL